MNDFTFDEKTHSYFLDGKRLTGVTSIIGVLAKPALISWSARVAVDYLISYAKEFAQDGKIDVVLLEGRADAAKKIHSTIKEAAGEHGTSLHEMVEHWINTCLHAGHEGKPNAMYRPEIEKFALWADENVDHFLFSERRMFNREMFVAGTADFAYVGKDGKRYMADLKTSSGIYGIDYWLQVAAYRLLAEGEGDTPYDGATVVRMGKDGSFEVQHRFDYQTDKEAFLACLTLYRAQATYVKH